MYYVYAGSSRIKMNKQRYEGEISMTEESGLIKNTFFQMKSELFRFRHQEGSMHEFLANIKKEVILRETHDLRGQDVRTN